MTQEQFKRVYSNFRPNFGMPIGLHPNIIHELEVTPPEKSGAGFIIENGKLKTL